MRTATTAHPSSYQNNSGTFAATYATTATIAPTATLTNSTISGNSASGSGGGIDVAAGSATIAGSTISGNSAAASAASTSARPVL